MPPLLKPRSILLLAGITALVLLLAIVIALHSPTTAGPSPALPPAALPGKKDIVATLRTLDEWVDGMPLWAELTFENQGDAPIKPIAHQWLFEYQNITVVLAETASHKEAFRRDLPVVYFSGAGGGRPGSSGTSVEVPPHGTLTAMLRLAGPDDPLPPGNYTLTILSNLMEASRSNESLIGAAAPLKIRAATRVEEPFLRRVKSMMDYPTDKNAPPYMPNPPASIKGLLAMDEALHTLFTTHKVAQGTPPADPIQRSRFDFMEAKAKSEIGQLDLQTLDIVVPDLLEPTVNVMRYEMLRAKDMNDNAQALKALVLKDHPGYEWIFKSAAFDPLHGQVDSGIITDGRRRANP